MKNILISLWNFILSLTLIDVIFFVAVLTLIILIVIMIHIMRTEEELVFQGEENNKTDNNVVVNNLENSEALDLLSISKEIDAVPPRTIELTPYEEEQEERAIISYDELINSNTGQMRLNYEKEEENDGLLVKKVDMGNINVLDESLPKLANAINDDLNSKVPVISYQKEEEFLAALKKMQQMLY